jgi:hypothetical protein
MPDINKYPYRLDSAFFTHIDITRAPAIPTEIKTSWKALIKYDTREPSQFQIFVKLATDSEQPIIFIIELVGIFSVLDENPLPEKSAIEEYLNEQALYGLWPYFVQMIASLSSQMGINPIRIPTPYRYDVRLSDEEEDETESEPEEESK